MNYARTGLLLFFISAVSFAMDSDTPATESTSEKDAPNILYVIPWNETPTKKAKDPKLVLHNMVGDLYEPQLPSDWQ